MINVLFDIDGTIMTVPPAVDIKTSAVMFKEVFGVDADESFIDNSAKPERYIIIQVLKKLGIELKKVPTEAYVCWAEAEAKELKNNPANILPGIKDLLQNLSNNRNVKLSLLTGNSYFRADVKLKSVDLNNYFRNSETGKLNGVFGNDGSIREELLLKFIDQKKKEDKVIILDDSLLGGEMAKKNKVPILLIATGKFSVEILRQFSEHTFKDLGENRWQKVISIIESLNI